MLTFGGYPLFPTSTNNDRKRCSDCGEWYDARLDHCPYCKNGVMSRAKIICAIQAVKEISIKPVDGCYHFRDMPDIGLVPFDPDK